MKTPFPHHPEPRTYTWTKLEEEAIKAALMAAYNEAIEHCARLSEGHYGDGHRLAEIIRTYKETP